MTIDLHLGDCIDIMRSLEENSVDAIITDPPYELGFMGKSWDSTGIAFNVEVWKEALRVLKPGGHLLAFSGSRTYHRMAVAIEDAGFEIRDQIMWIYGSGFPKSLDVSKAIDNKFGNKGGDRITKEPFERNTFSTAVDVEFAGTPVAKESAQWQGWGTALKPSHEPIVVARKPLIGTVANNVLTHGTGALNIDATRVATFDVFGGGSKGSSGFAQGYDGEGWEPGSQLGRWPANVIHDGSDEVVELFPTTKPSKSGLRNPNGKKSTNAFGDYNGQPGVVGGHDDNGGSAARFFYCAKANKRDRNEGLDGFAAKNNRKMMGNANNTAEVASKGFERFDTQPSQNHHPTVKPTDLMRYLCRLVTPPQGIVLDPFMGSGSTGKAAVYEGFNFIGIEMQQEYLDIARARIYFAERQEKEKLL